MSAATEDHTVAVTIEDTGIGIPAEDQQRLFSKFFRASNALRRETEGTGLGLFVVRSLIERIGGTLSFKSPLMTERKADGTVEPRGTSFTVAFPWKACIMNRVKHS